MSGLTIELDLSDIVGFSNDLGRVRGYASTEMRNATTASLNVLEANIVRRTPVNVGILRNSISHRINGTPLNLDGEVFTAIPYGLPVENGRKAGKMPPVNAIRVWAIRKMGLSDAEADSAAYLIARAIGKRGTKGAFMFRDGFAESKPIIIRLLETIPRKILARLERGQV